MRRPYVHVTCLLSLVLTMALLPATSQAESALSASFGTTGLGVEWITPLNDKLRARVMLTYIGIDGDLEEEDIDYEIEFDSANFGAVLEWHPFGGSFRVSGGLVGTNFGFDLLSDSAQQSYDIGNDTYSGNLQLEGDVEFADVAPYFAVGWSSDLDDYGLYLGLEFGVLYVGSPRLSLDASGEIISEDINNGQPVNVGNNADFQADLELERQNLEDEVEDYSLYPILTFSVGYRF
ncbi:MAG: hypothetical protein ACR2PS_18060 [Pseudomonadales bacterium]